MDKDVEKMLKQECPSCGSTSGDVIAYMPIVEGEGFEVEIECENCGAKGFLRGILVETEHQE